MNKPVIKKPTKKVGASIHKKLTTPSSIPIIRNIQPIQSTQNAIPQSLLNNISQPTQINVQRNSSQTIGTNKAIKKKVVVK